MTFETDVHVPKRQSPKIRPERLLYNIKINPNVFIIGFRLSPSESFLNFHRLNLLGFVVLREQLLLTVKMCRIWMHILNFECEGLFLFQTPNLEPESRFYRPETEATCC